MGQAEPEVESIRRAIESGDYAGALELWNRYADLLAAGALSQATLAVAAELIAWSRPLLTAARADALRRLRALHVAGTYGERPPGRSVLVRASL
jgi:hypothetical protein